MLVLWLCYDHLVPVSGAISFLAYHLTMRVWPWWRMVHSETWRSMKLLLTALLFPIVSHVSLLSLSFPTILLFLLSPLSLIVPYCPYHSLLFPLSPIVPTVPYCLLLSPIVPTIPIVSYYPYCFLLSLYCILLSPTFFFCSSLIPFFFMLFRPFHFGQIKRQLKISKSKRMNLR